MIGHSLGCTAIAHWAARYNKTIKGALLVPPSDIESVDYIFPATGFSPIPLAPFKFNSIVVTGTNDIWVSNERAVFFATNWKSTFIYIGDG